MSKEKIGFIRCTKCGELFASEKEAKKHYCIEQIQDIVSRTTAPFRGPRSLGQRKSRQQASITGGIELSFLRGYQSGYEDRVMGKKPQHYAREHRKDIRKQED